MPTFTNIRGTSEPQFRISLSGPTIYHGTAAPGVGTPPSSEIYDELHEGDTYILHNGLNSSMYIYIGPTDSDWVEFLVTGGTAPTITSDLSVHGTFDTYDNIITLNSQPAALVGGIGGMEILRVTGGSETVQWIWNDFNSYWEPSTDASTPNTGLHNVHVENNLTVGGTVAGRLTAPNGLATTPGIRFSAAGTGIYATATTLGFSTGGSSRWLIDASGNFLGAQNIGGTGSLVGNIYGTLFAGADGASGTPTFTFDSELTTGLYKSGAGIIGFSILGTPVASLNATEMELQGTLKITDGTSWTIDNDGADSNKLKFAHSATDYAILTTSGELLVGDGALANPSHSFISDDTVGMYLNSGDIKFTLDGISQHLIISPTAITAPTAVTTNPQDLATKAYVDGITGGSWREPVIVKEDTVYVSLVLAEAALNVAGLVDGVSMTTNDRVLYTSITGENKNVFVVNGTLPTFTLVEDGIPSFGDTIYVNEGTSNGKIFSYDIAGIWTGVSGSGGGGTMYFDYDVQVAIALQTVFTLSTAKYAPTPDGSRLLVYVNGVKQIFGITEAYVETDEITVTFNVAPGVGKIVEFYAVGLATNDGILIRETQTGLAPTPVITFNVITYATGQAGLLVYLNGQKMVLGTAYTEINNTSIQWVGPALVNADVLEFYSSAPIIAGVNLEDLGNVSGAPAPLNNYELRYNTAFGVWEPRDPGTSQTGLLYDDDTTLVGAIDGINAVFTTVNTAVAPKSGGRAFQQVFVNGVLQREGVNYTPTSPNIITFIAGSIPVPLDIIDVYQL